LSTAPRLKALTGARDAKQYKRKYKFQIANLKTVMMQYVAVSIHYEVTDFFRPDKL